MRWVVWNVLGCLLWIAGIAHVKGLVFFASGLTGESNPVLAGFCLGLSGLVLLMWANLADVS